MLKELLPEWMGRAPTDREWKWIGWTLLMLFFAFSGWLIWETI